MQRPERLSKRQFDAVLRRVMLSRRARCPRCRYDLDGVPGPRCPECGAVIEEFLRLVDTRPDKSPELRRKVRLRTARRVGVLLLAAALIGGGAAAALCAAIY